MSCLRVRAAILASTMLMPLCSCASLPKNVERTPSAALADTGDTRLGRALADSVAAHPGRSGISPLPDGVDAFAARIALAAAAERSLDVQYYLWHQDTTGRLMFEALWQAADRGVRVRVLLDDADTGGLDATIAALDAHPNIEVRLFNPFAHRTLRWAGDGVTDFNRINHRMHNKSFNADNQAAIVGGRNIGDEYYDAGPGFDFYDLDVLAVGPVAREVSEQFDRYWASESAYPAASVIEPAAPDAAARLRGEWAEVRQDPKTGRYLDAARRTPLVRALLERRMAFEWVPARIVVDDPAKALQPPGRADLKMLPRLEETIGRPVGELDIVSPYFIPGKEGMEGLRALAARGVRVRVLTNALAATDTSPVHAGYSKYREDLLRGGVRLYELKPGADTRKRNREDPEHHGLGGSSSASLHAKTFAVDRQRIFVGSFNFDPRSARLNTEMGVVIDSAPLAALLSEALDTRIPDDAYEVRLAADGRGLEWVERTGGGEVVHTTEPRTRWPQRAWVGLLALLPIERLL